MSLLEDLKQQLHNFMIRIRVMYVELSEKIKWST